MKDIGKTGLFCPRRERTHRDDWNLSKGLLWGGLEVVGVADRLVGDHPNETLEERGFSLFRHECLLVIGSNWL